MVKTIYRDKDDITIIPRGEGEILIATDVCAGIGEKKSDSLYAPNEMVASATTRVVILELLCQNANIQSLQYGIAGTYEDTVAPMLEGMYQELRKANVEGVMVNGSHESNMLTTMTSLTITGIGYRQSRPTRSGEELYVLGKPLVGQAVIDEADKVAGYDDIKELLALHMDCIPLGSRGVLHELEQLGAPYSILEDWQSEELSHSAGPATAILVIGNLPREVLHKMPIRKLGYLIKENE